MEKEFYTIKETAKLFQVHFQTIRNWIREKRIKAIKMGDKNSTVRISGKEIERIKNDKK